MITEPVAAPDVAKQRGTPVSTALGYHLYSWHCYVPWGFKFKHECHFGEASGY
jgi:hypothetical protein